MKDIQSGSKEERSRKSDVFVSFQSLAEEETSHTPSLPPRRACSSGHQDPVPLDVLHTQRFLLNFFY